VAGSDIHLVFASTGAVYDSAAPQPFTESSRLKPTNPYAQSKLQAEDLLRSASHEASGLQVTVLRFFNVAGAACGRGDGDTSRIIPRALAVAGGNAPALHVNGDGSAVRDFVHVLDAARAIIAALQVADPGTVRTYNVGATAASVADIIAVCSKLTGRDIAVEYLPPQPEPQVLLADCGSIRRDLGWVPASSDLPVIIADAWAATLQK
jgi:UDP-glucose 4-epimerase